MEMAIPVAQLGWMAGIVDMKGRLIYKVNKQRADGSRQICLSVDCKEIHIIRKLGSMTGTNPDMIKAQAIPGFLRRGCNEHCPDSHIHVNDEVVMPRHARWTITGAGMVVVLNNLDPYLVIDRGYDDAVIQVIEQTPMTGQGAHAVHRSLSRLKELGWDLPPVFNKALEAVAA